MSGHYMQKLLCSRCGKRLWKKHARMIGGKIMCSACMFGNAKVDGRPKGRDGLSGSGSADQRGDAEGGIRLNSISQHPRDIKP